MLEAIQWRDGALVLLDQRRLPQTEDYIECYDANAVADAIRNMVVRGAPAIGIAAAYGMALAAARGDDLAAASAVLAASRPTAVNLVWALERVGRALDTAAAAPARVALETAREIHAEDIAQNRHMGQLGAAYLGDRPLNVMTHCNTGALATGGYGTALGVIRAGHARGSIRRVFCTETRPWQQGARLTAWELAHDGIPASLCVDSAAAYVMRSHQPGWLIVGADRIAANGDVANKIGTYALACLAREHGLRTMVVAPSGTLDLSLASGADIPIEDRGPDELWRGMGEVPTGLQILNPSFDVTPAAWIDVLVTEKGALESPDAVAIAALMGAD